MNTNPITLALPSVLFALLSACATDPPDPEKALQRAMVGCARQIPEEYLAITTPKIYYVHREGDRFYCNWSSSNSSNTSQEQLIAHVRMSYPDAELVAANDQVLVQVPPKRAKKVDSGPSWTEILLNGAAQISAAYAGRSSSVPAYHSSASDMSTQTSASLNQENSLHAPYVSPSCARLTADSYDPIQGANLYYWENVCTHPIQVNWCWVPKGRTTCTPDMASSTILPGERALTIGDGGKERETPAYFVCDMSRREQLCVAAK